MTAPSKHLQTIAQSLFYLSLVLLAVVLGKLAWKIIAPPSSAAFSSSASDITVNTSASPTINLSTIIASNLFGTSEPTKAVTKTVVKPAKEIKQTKLNLQLVGLIKGLNSVAVIIYNARQGAYAPGDYIVNKSNLKVKLISVMNDYVVISNNAVQERLTLPKKAIKAASQVGISQNTSTPTQQESIELDLNSQQMKSLLGDNPKRVITTNPLSLSKYMQISPKLVNGQLTGYQIASGPDKRLLSAAGIEAGDIITHVEGRPAAQLTIANMYKNLQLKSSINVTVERNGSVMTMDIKL